MKISFYWVIIFIFSILIILLFHAPANVLNHD